MTIEDSAGANTTKKYKLQWQCAALYATEMLTNSRSEYRAIICENLEDFELETNDNKKIIIQVTHSDNKKNFGKKDDKILKTFKNFKKVFLENDRVNKFILISNVSLFGITNDETRIKDKLNDKDIKFYKSYLNCQDNTFDELFNKIIFKKINLDYIENEILDLLGKKYDLKYNTLIKIRKIIIEIMQNASTALSKKELELKELYTIEFDDKARKTFVIESKRITKENIEKIIFEIIGKVVDKREHLFFDNGLMLLKNDHTISSKTFEDWKNGFGFELNDIRYNRDLKRQKCTLMK